MKNNERYDRLAVIVGFVSLEAIFVLFTWSLGRLGTDAALDFSKDFPVLAPAAVMTEAGFWTFFVMGLILFNWMLIYTAFHVSVLLRKGERGMPRKRETVPKARSAPTSIHPSA